jgi:predicted metal-binding membrane protein
MIALGHRRYFLLLMSGLLGSTWLALWVWTASPYGRWLDHGQWTESGLAAALCRALPAGQLVLPALLYGSGWLLMSAAMMLPTAWPLLNIFDRLTASRADHRSLMALVILGYLSVWGVFGLLAHGLDHLLHAIAAESSWLLINGWIVGAAILGVAGAFQFSALKYHCLDKCRTPLSFVMEHWRGYAHHWHALKLGVRHGAFCVGCCWAIMLIMFVVGTGSVGWMLALGAVMAIEKNAPWGRKLSPWLGASLLGWAAFILVAHLPWLELS